MTKRIVEQSEPVTLVGGGEATVADVAEALALAPTCVAADGGLNLALAAGVAPVAVIGDFDSVRADDLARVPVDRRMPIAEQDSTDFDKALRHILAPVVLAVGFSGGRMDHQLAVWHGLVAQPDRPCIVIGATELAFLCPSSVALPTAPGDVVSLFPLAPVTGRSTGLRWPIEGLDFAPDRLIGTSNAAEGPVQLSMDAPAMLVILPRRLLRDVTQALAQADGRWPARAKRYRDPPQS